MLTAWLLLLLASLAGAALTTLFDPGPGRLSERLAAGTVAGQAAFALLATALGPGLGFRAASLAGLLVLLGLGAVALLLPGGEKLATTSPAERRSALLPARPGLASVVLFALGFAVLAAALSTAVFERERELWTAADHNLGDLPFHLGIVESLVHGDGSRPEHPELSGTPLTYPYAVDVVAAALVDSGVSRSDALRTQNLFLGGALLVLLVAWARAATGSRAAAWLTPALALLNGGIGLGLLLQETGFDLQALAASRFDVTIRDAWGLRWGNAVAVLLIPQRAFLLGLPLGLAAATLGFRAIQADPGSRPERGLALGAGLLLGLLPFAHAHSFAAIGFCLFAVAAARRRWSLWPLFALALVLAIPQILFLASGSGVQASRFLDLAIGWDRGNQNPVLFWLRNAFLFLPLAAAAFIVLRHTAPVRLLWPFALLFVLPNLFRLSPWIWDNLKLLYWAQVGLSPLIALLLLRIGAGSPVRLAVAGLAFLFTVASGAFDVWRLARGGSPRLLFDDEGIAFAEQVAARTPPRTRLATAPSFDHPALLAGRPQVLGYEGHIWSQGLDPSSRRAELESAYAGEPAGLAALRARGVEALVVGPRERRELRVNQDALAGLGLSLIVESGPWKLYGMGARP